MHPHSQTPGRTSDREGGQHTAGAAPAAKETAESGGDTLPPVTDTAATGPFSGSAENGYRPASRASAPNPYTSRRVSNVDDVDTGATPITQWRGVGLDEPEPRSPHIPATTDTMTDTSSSPERAERPEAPATHTPAPEPQRQEVPASETRWPEPRTGTPQAAQLSQAAQQSQEAWQRPADRPQQPSAGPGEPRAERPQAPQPERPEAQAPSPYQQPSTSHEPPVQERYSEQRYGDAARAGQQYPGDRSQAPQPPDGRYAAPYQGDGRHQGPAPQAGQYQGEAPWGGQYGNPYEPPRYSGHEQYQPHPQAPAGYPAHRQDAYAPPPPPQYGAYAPPQGQPMPPQHAPYPAPYPQQPVVAYPSPYPVPFQPPGYVLHGQPVFYPGQYNPYGQPVQHVIVLAAGQQPQVITTESASALLAEHAGRTTTAEEVREDRAAERARAVEEAAPAPAVAAEPEPKAVTGAPAAPIEAPEPGTAAAPEEERAPAEPEVPSDLPERAALVEEIAALRGKQGTLLNEALAGLAMRDLSLVDALLEMVEELETDAQDPDLLDKLFQIDNFATRMRRNGENLLVLTGHDGGESDAHDEIVPLLDVARAATSEIKDYPRVRLGKLPQTSITGMAADDISHLLAELLDNATANSPEHSQVVISGQEMDDGRLMIVVEDEGVGIPENQLAELNARLGGQPVLDDEVPRHMGLYVASRIAIKHGLETRLESRSFRGVSAYAIIPKELLRVATPRTPGQARTSTIPTVKAPAVPSAPAAPRPIPGTGANGAPAAAPKEGAASSVTAAGLPRRSATPHGSPLRRMPRPGTVTEPPKGRADTPPKLTGEARAAQIRDELGDFLEGERAALEGEEIEGDDK
ncbi:ATP-binding protein [Nocardiopsis umidischolae]|uniref:histidine kinase n=1 Tax=Nocardiopsis tropica TaxID=109330 RepID=A0ABU7KXI2_9ACTN|nr:ATP-binding protein [Nocardiopsis umidischolae]